MLNERSQTQMPEIIPFYLYEIFRIGKTIDKVMGLGLEGVVVIAKRNRVSFFFFLFIYLFLAALGPRCCTRALSSFSEGGATLCCGAQAPHRGGLTRCGARAPGTQATAVVAHGL